MSAYSSSPNHSPAAILNEYATKYHLVHHYNLIHDGTSHNIVSFKYSVNLGKFVAEGKGHSKKEAKHLAASNLLKKMIDDEPQLLNTDFKQYMICPYDENIKLNALFTKMDIEDEVDQQDTHAYSSSSNKSPVSILNEYANQNHLVPQYNLIHDVSSLGIVSFKYSVNLGKFVAEGKGSSKKEAKHLAASNLLKTIIDDKPQLLNTDFKEYPIYPYDKNIKPNAHFTKMNTADEVDQQDMSEDSSSLNRHPVSILNEYAAKNHLVPHYNLIQDVSPLGIVSFKYSVNLGKFVAEGKGLSKKEAKHLAASNLLKKIIDDKPQLLNTDFKEYPIYPYDKNIKVNYIGQLDDLCRHKNSKLPEYNLVKEEEQGHNKLFTGSCHAPKIIEAATHRTEQQAKYLDASEMAISSMCSDIEVEKSQKNVEIKKSITKHPTNSSCEDYHLVLKNTEWENSDTLNMVFNQFIKNGKLDLPEPLNILNKIITEHKNMHITSRIEKIKMDFNNYSHLCSFVLTNVWPNIYGCGMDTNFEKAQHIAAKELLFNICILLK